MPHAVGTVIVGASAAGLSVAESLRAAGYRDTITMLGAEGRLPYDRPPLSKQVLAGTWPATQADLCTAQALAALGVDAALNEPALALDVETRTVRTGQRAIAAEHVVIATGAAPRTLAEQPPVAGVHLLRTVDDAVALRGDLAPGVRLVIVGDGVLGAEVAATATALGVDVTIVGPHRAPMAAQLGDVVADALADVHADAGVTLQTGAQVTGLIADQGAVTGVMLDTGDALPADVVLVALGVRPNTEWLTSSRLTVRDGVVCDAFCCAADGIYAAGDVARWHHEVFGSVRFENRTNASEQATAVAAAIMGAGTPYAPVPYFWSDQHGIRIQVHGIAAPGDEFVVVDGEMAARRFVGQLHREGRIVGVIGWNMRKQVRLLRQEMTSALVN